MIGNEDLFDFFTISPTPILVLHIGVPKFTIVDVNQANLETLLIKHNLRKKTALVLRHTCTIMFVNYNENNYEK